MFKIKGLTLQQTCFACPEQYDVFTEEGQQVGYMRLRNGFFRVDYPDCGGETVYSAETRGDGLFYDEKERETHLTRGVQAILEKLTQSI